MSAEPEKCHKRRNEACRCVLGAALCDGIGPNYRPDATPAAQEKVSQLETELYAVREGGGHGE